VITTSLINRSGRAVKRVLSAWDTPERVAVNVATLYRECSGDDSGPDTLALFGLMARLHKGRR